MTTIMASSSYRHTTTYRSFDGIGNSLEYSEIIKKYQEVEEHNQAKPSSESSILLYLVKNYSDIYKFEKRIEWIRELLLDGKHIFSRKDIAVLRLGFNSFQPSVLLPLIRLLGPLLEDSSYSQEAAEMIRKLLEHENPEVRYTALESMSFALGETPIADKLLDEARILLSDEKVPFVREYLEEL